MMFTGNWEYNLGAKHCQSAGVGTAVKHWVVSPGSHRNVSTFKSFSVESYISASGVMQMNISTGFAGIIQKLLTCQKIWALVFSQHCCGRYESSGMWLCFGWVNSSSVSKDYGAFIFMVKILKDHGASSSGSRSLFQRIVVPTSSGSSSPGRLGLLNSEAGGTMIVWNAGYYLLNQHSFTFQKAWLFECKMCFRKINQFEPPFQVVTYTAVA
jgi:hypothetical protein